MRRRPLPLRSTSSWPGEGSRGTLPQREPLAFNFVTTFYPPYNFGGDGIFVYRLANALAVRGHRVRVVHCADAYDYLSQRPAGDPPPHHPGVDVRTVRRPLGALSPILTYATGLPAGKVSALRRELDPNADVTHFHNTSLIGGPGVLDYGGGVKLYTAHEHWLVCPTHILWKLDREPCKQRACLRCTVKSGRPPQFWRYTPLLQRKLRQLDALIVASRFSRDRHAALDVRTELLPHFVPEPTPPIDGPSPHPRPFVLYTGRLEKPKGILWLIDVFRTFRGIDLLVAGDGTDAMQARAAASDAPHVRFVGRLGRCELDHLYRSALAVIVPSLCYETFGLVAVESLACGTPILVRDRGPLPEVVDDSGAGLVFHDADGLIAAVTRLRDDPTLRAELGRRGVEAYRRLWTESRHVDRYLDLIEILRAERAGACREAGDVGTPNQSAWTRR
jgi:glycosyltransferase involved in cell wall biosynthesis